MSSCNFAATAAKLALTSSMEWAPLHRSPSSHLIPFTFGVRYNETSIATLEDTFWKVSDPASSVYGKHLSEEDVATLMTPPSERVQAVVDWLLASNASSAMGGIYNLSLSPYSDYVRGVATVEAFEALLENKVQLYEHHIPSAASFFSRTYHAWMPRSDATATHTPSSVSLLPSKMQEYIDFIHPSSYLPSPRNLVSPYYSVKAADDEVSTSTIVGATGVTPTVIRTQYGIDDIESKTPSNKQQAAGFLGQYASQSDLDIFYSQFYPVANGRKLNFYGPVNTTAPMGVEASLDVQYVTSIGGNVNTTFFYVDGCYDNCNNEPYTVWLSQVLALSDGDLPHVLSVSYGDNENTVPIDFATKANTGFMALGARGSSVLFSSGDGGVAGSQSSPCTTFLPTFPAGSLFVTSVGGTTGSPETAASFSSGGFSNYFLRPSIQDAAVASYFKTAKNLPPAADYNGTYGRAIPDVSALSESFNIVCGQGTLQVDGTSCAAPTFAGFVSLLNDLRLQQGKPTLGFLNTLFYANPSVFTDITEGNNPGCGTNGFYAAPGYDPVTGLGSPVYSKMAALVQSLS